MATSNVININGRDYDMSSPTSEKYKRMYIESFGDSIPDNQPVNIEVTDHSVDGYYLEIKSEPNIPLNVQFFDSEGNPVYKTELSSGMYSKLSRRYHTDWRTKISSDSFSFDYDFDLGILNIVLEKK